MLGAFQCVQEREHDRNLSFENRFAARWLETILAERESTVFSMKVRQQYSKL